MAGPNLKSLASLAAMAAIGNGLALPLEASTLHARSVNDTQVCQATLTKASWVDGKYEGAVLDYLQSGPPQDYWDSQAGFSQPGQSQLSIINTYASKIIDLSCQPKDFGGPSCDALNMGSEENCDVGGPDGGVNLPAAVTTLKAVTRYAQFANDLANSFRGAQADIQAKGADLVNWFITDQSDASFAGMSKASGALVMLSGVMGMLGLAGGPMGAVAASIGSMAAVPIGMTSLVSSSGGDTEQQFDQWSDFNSFVADMTSGMSAATLNAANMSLNAIPDTQGQSWNDWVQQNGLSLYNILKDGSFADNASGALTADQKTNIGNFVVQAAINHLMIKNKIIVVRVDASEYGIPSMGGGDLCGPPDHNRPFDSKLKWCDDQGFMYTLQRWVSVTDYDVPGLDKLEQFGLDIPSIVKGSWDWQQKHGFGHTPSPDDAAEVAKNFNAASVDFRGMQTWTLPVCDMDTWREPAGGYDPSQLACTTPECWYRLNMWCRCPQVTGWNMGSVSAPGHEANILDQGRSALCYVGS